MDKGTLLTAKRLNADYSLSSSTATVASHLGPTLDRAIYLQHIIGSVAVFLGLQAQTLTSITLHVGKLAAFYAFIAASSGAGMSAKLLYGAWETELLQDLRRRLSFEFFVFILGGGNRLILMLFWPGWWILTGTTCTVWFLWGSSATAK